MVSEDLVNLIRSLRINELDSDEIERKLTEAPEEEVRELNEFLLTTINDE